MAAPKQTPEQWAHGTISTYNYRGCRCTPCKGAARAIRERGLPEGSPSHGIYGYKSFGCRCDICNDANRGYNLRTMYNISLQQYMELWESQHGVCAACNKPEGDRLWLSVDHDHNCCAGRKSCGKCVRGLLCANCNKTAGLLGDKADLLRKLADYLDRYGMENNLPVYELEESLF